MSSKIHIIGQKFNRLTPTKKVGEYHWCRCDCGADKLVRTDKIKSGLTKSCGCWAAEVTAARKKPAKPPKAATPLDKQQLRKRWYSMQRRCTNPKDPQWKNYGGRGITVCARWNDFELFYADMRASFRPHLQLERIDNSLGYSPENCTFATPLAQGRNRRDNVLVAWRNGTMHPLTKTAEHLQWPYSRVYRLYYRVKQNNHESYIPTTRDLQAAHLSGKRTKIAAWLLSDNESESKDFDWV